jgi:hypothetical protein
MRGPAGVYTGSFLLGSKLLFQEGQSVALAAGSATI